MSVVHSLVKQAAGPQAHFKPVLDKLATDPKQDPVALLLDTS